MLRIPFPLALMHAGTCFVILTIGYFLEGKSVAVGICACLMGMLTIWGLTMVSSNHK